MRSYLATKKITQFFLILIFACFAGFSAPQEAHAIGGSPSALQVDSVLSGVPVAASFNITRAPTDPQGDLTVFVETHGEHAHYVIIEPSFVMAEGEDSYRYEFEILATEAVLGDYSASIAFYVNPGSEAGEMTTGVSVRRGVEMPIWFTVDNIEVIEYELNSLYPNATEVGEDLIIGYSVKNTGNLTWAPDKAIFTFIDTTDATNTYEIELSGQDAPSVSPGNKGEPIDLVFKPNIPAGQYFTKVVLYENGEIVGEMESKQFSVYPKGTLAQSAEVEYFKTNKTSYLTGENIQLESSMMNTGEISVSAVMAVDIYKEGTLVDYLRSDPLTFGVGENGVLTDLFSLEEAGIYTLSSYVSYGNRRTTPLELDIEVYATNALSQTQMIVILVIVCFALILLAIIFKRMKKEKDVQPPYPPTTYSQPPTTPQA